MNMDDKYYDKHSENLDKEYYEKLDLEIFCHDRCMTCEFYDEETGCMHNLDAVRCYQESEVQ